jgi:ATP-dependent Lon protease
MTRFEKMTTDRKTRQSKDISKTKKAKKQQPPSDSESEYESEYETDSSSDSSYKPTKKNSTKNKYKKEKFLNSIFPSKYMNNKMKNTKKKVNSQKINKKKRKQEEEEDDDEEDDDEEEYDDEDEEDEEDEDDEEDEEDEEDYEDDEDDEDEEDEEDDEDDEDEEDEEDDEDYEEEDLEDEESGNVLNILLDLGGEGDEGEEYFEDDADEQCDSEDEQTFMKEKYEKVENILQEKKDKKKNKKEKLRLKKEKEEQDRKNVENKYLELVDAKKSTIKQLEKTKNSYLSKRYKKDLTQIDKEIKKLIKKSRSKNAKQYHSLIHSSKKRTNEIDYFKKNLSNKQQLQVMEDLEEINKHINVDKPYRLALLDSDMPSNFKAIAMQRLNVLRTMDQTDPEYYKIKNWVDTFMKIPFGIYNSLSISMKDGIDVSHEFITNAKKTLDDCVYGLDDAKMQIMQLAGQWITNPSALGTAIAIKGPMGTGKTTLVKEGISKILGREFAFIALGGTGDASFLEGHSYTYEGSTWGKIVQILIDSKCMNPVIFFDELDKLSETPKGDEINGILTHLTDTSQNSEFHDKYFSEVNFDISKCLFIFSYNDESKVNPILKDRMYRIQTKGYETKEKLVIANKHLLPKIREQVNFAEEDIIIPDKTIEYIASTPELTNNESGVRNLKRCLEIIHTKLNLFRLVKSDSEMFSKELKMEVKFPFTVEIEHVKKLINVETNENTSMQMLYI